MILSCRVGKTKLEKIVQKIMCVLLLWRQSGWFSKKKKRSKYHTVLCIDMYRRKTSVYPPNQPYLTLPFKTETAKRDNY